MSVAFFKGQQLGPEDLDINLVNASGHPTNAAEIHYALYDVTTGQEVLLGTPRRTPANPAVGHYYASLIIPLDANLGSYRIRWTMREMAGGPIHQVVQEFEVVDKAQPLVSVYTPCEEEMIRRLRILLRDNCVGGEEEVELDLGEERIVVRMDDLWEALKDEPRPPR